jgi:hypothetical protein
MRWVLLSGVGAVLWVCAARAEGTGKSYTFGGFSPGGREYWKRGPDDLACEPAPSTTCRPIEKKDTRSFVKPPRGRKAGGLSLSVAIDEEKRVSLRGGERDLGSFAPGGRVVSVNANLFVAPDGDLVAVEYEVHDKGGKRGDVVVFDLRADAAAPPPATAPVATGNAYDRAMAKGGVWEQRIVPCDVAGVTLKLQKTKKFGIRITTKCQGQKDVTELDGTWATEGDDTLVLSFPNEEGPLENMVCRFAACEDVAEDCLTCTQDDVTFTMQVVRR